MRHVIIIIDLKEIRYY